MSSKKVLIISSSPRIGGNSDRLCDEFMLGAESAGHAVEKITLAEKKIGYCTACYACRKGSCPQKDDAAAIIKKMQSADVIVLATPVYFYTMCAQLKALIDRSVMVYPDITGKDFYFLMSMADTDRENFNGTIQALRGFVACCGNSRECGTVAVEGVYERGEIENNNVLLQARSMGKNC